MTDAGPARHELVGFPDAVLHFVRAMEGNRREVARNWGLTEIEIRALFRIAEAGHIMPKRLAADLSVTTGAVTGVSDRLIETGLVGRIAHPEDRRSLFLELTNQGHVAMKKMHRDFIAMLETAASEVDATELAAATETLRLVTQRVNEQSGRVHPRS